MRSVGGVEEGRGVRATGPACVKSVRVTKFDKF